MALIVSKDIINYWRGRRDLNVGGGAEIKMSLFRTKKPERVHFMSTGLKGGNCRDKREGRGAGGL